MEIELGLLGREIEGENEIAVPCIFGGFLGGIEVEEEVKEENRQVDMGWWGK